jgi:hypothetical protein
MNNKDELQVSLRTNEKENMHFHVINQRSSAHMASFDVGEIIIDLLEMDFDTFIKKSRYEIFQPILNLKVYNDIKNIYQQICAICFDDNIDKEIPFYKIIEKGTHLQRYLYSQYFMNEQYSTKLNIRICSYEGLTGPNPSINMFNTIATLGSLPPDFNSTTQEGKINTFFSNEKIDVIESYLCNTFYDVMYLELRDIIKENIPIKKCKCCHKYFIPSGRTDTNYCKNIAPNSSKTCSEVGATKVYFDSRKGNEIFELFDKEYKKRHAWIRLKKYINGRQYKNSDFSIWSQKAREMRDKVVRGEINIQEFKEFLSNKESE